MPRRGASIWSTLLQFLWNQKHVGYRKWQFGREFPEYQSAGAVQLMWLSNWCISDGPGSLYHINEVPTLPALIINTKTQLCLWFTDVFSPTGESVPRVWCPQCWGREEVSTLCCVSVWLTLQSELMSCWQVKWGQVRRRKCVLFSSLPCRGHVVLYQTGVKMSQCDLKCRTKTFPTMAELCL